jgi:hypothetical protein
VGRRRMPSLAAGWALSSRPCPSGHRGLPRRRGSRPAGSSATAMGLMPGESWDSLCWRVGNGPAPSTRVSRCHSALVRSNEAVGRRGRRSARVGRHRGSARGAGDAGGKRPGCEPLNATKPRGVYPDSIRQTSSGTARAPASASRGTNATTPRREGSAAGHSAARDRPGKPARSPGTGPCSQRPGITSPAS